MNVFLGALLDGWVWRMAWRESRTRRRRLLLFGSSIVLGIAALIAISSFRDQVLVAIEEQARTLLGADLVLAGRTRFGPEEEEVFRSVGGRQAREIDFSSMALFPASGGTRLVQVRAIEGEFPFYGELEAEPSESVSRWRSEGGALVEETLLAQFNSKIGDELKIGDLRLRITGRLRKVPGDSVVFATLAPRVYLRQVDLARANLLREGSLARYKVYFQLKDGKEAESVVKSLKPKLDQFRLGHTTVSRRKEDLGDSLENLSNFLSLVGFVALFLGGIGVASAIHTHVKEKLPGIAMLRCLGASSAQTFSIYLVQSLALGLIASVAGAALGLLIQLSLPRVLGDFLPVRVPFALGGWNLVKGMSIGFAFSVVFALLPLLEVRGASPLTALRLAAGAERGRRHRWETALVYLLILVASVLFAVTHSDKWRHGLGFIAGLAAAFALLTVVAWLLVWSVRRWMPASLPFAWRQGLSNLHRPNNRTTLLLLSLGLGTFVMLTLYLTQAILVKQVMSEGGAQRPNAVFFDIQPDQRDGMRELLRSQGVPLLDEAPIVTMRLAKLKARSIEDLLGDTNRSTARWALRREYRSTWRSQLSDAETLVSGVWHPAYEASREVTPVSLEEGIAKDLGVGLGDEITFDVQGIPLTTRVASLRRVDWRRVQPNFFVVFPPGVLESAPAFYVAVTRTASAQESAALQRAVVEKFPNVSAIDLTLVLNTLDSVLKKVSLAIRFMALFTVVTGLLVLAGAVLVSRHQRMRESILLRTLGASAAQIRRILLAEYASLGLLAALSAGLMSLAATWLLAHYVFRMAVTFQPLPIVTALVAVPVLTVVTGLLSSRGVATQPPMEILRQESI